jgi:DNA-binding transcriptional LysR family regulator
MSKVLHVEALNLRHLRAWLAVVDEGSITAAAKKLSVSQPALSQQIRALESFFGVDLIERLHRGIRPTPFGLALISQARATISTSERLIRQAKSAVDLQTGTLEIATLPTLVDAVMIEPIRRWQTRHPKVSIRIKEFALQSAMVEAVSIGLGDLAIGVRPPNWPGSLVSLGWEQFVVVLPPDDPLSGRNEPVDLQDLSDHNWILYEKSNGLSDYVTAACAMAGFRPHEAVRTSQVQVAIQLAMAGLGAVLMPASNVPANIKSAARSLKRPIVWELAAFARTEFSRPVEEFISLLKDLDWLDRPPNAVGLPGN